MKSSSEMCPVGIPQLPELIVIFMYSLWTPFQLQKLEIYSLVDSGEIELLNKSKVIEIKVRIISAHPKLNKN